MKETEWKKVNPDSKPNFIRIIQTLNRYYSAMDKNSNMDMGCMFRKKLEELPLSYYSIYLKRFGKYEYLVHAKLTLKSMKQTPKHTPPPMREDTWIHIDGIQEERDSFSNQGINDHPVFKIEGLTDIFEFGSIAVKRKFLPN